MTNLSLKGDVTIDVATLFAEQLSMLTKSDSPVTIRMSEADLENAEVVSLLVSHVRQAAIRVGRVQLIEPPQVLAHCLYRIGALETGAATIQLIEPRQEIGTAN